MKRLHPGFFLTLVFLLAATTALAQNQEEFCDNYAALAVEQINQAQSGACGQFPQNEAAWYGDYSSHYATCMQMDEMDAMAVMRGRHDHLLASCPDIAARYRCSVYSLETMANVAANRNLGCGYDESQPRWTPGFRPHFDWCEGSQPAQWDLDARTQSRADLIDQCVADHGENAGQAVDQGEIPMYSPDTALVTPEPGSGDAVSPAPSGGGSGSGGDDFSLLSEVPEGYEFQGDDFERDTMRDACMRYANITIKQVEYYSTHSCPSTSSSWSYGWSHDWMEHFEFCLDEINEEHIGSEPLPEQKLNGRETYLQNWCGLSHSPHIQCYDYAVLSSRLQYYNQNRGCHLTGGHWHSNLNKHYDHCVSYHMDQEDIDAAIQERNQMLDNCY